MQQPLRSIGNDNNHHYNEENDRIHNSAAVVEHTTPLELPVPRFLPRQQS